MRQALVLAVVSSSSLTNCRHSVPAPPADHPRIPAGVAVRDITFHSASLNRNMHYRMLLPDVIEKGEQLPVLYLLHGGGGSYLDWTNYTDVAQFAAGKSIETSANKFILVMPEGDDSYYVNSVTRAEDKYEDYITKDLIADVDERVPFAGREERGIAGVSMGGFGAIELGLRHPGLYSFVGAMSPALDAPSRPFSFRRIDQWRHFRSIFGGWNSKEQQDRDPYLAAQAADPTKAPFIFFTCGDAEGLLAANRKFARLLNSRRFGYEFQEVKGGHDWGQWDNRLDDLHRRAIEHLHVIRAFKVVSTCKSPMC